MRQPRATRRQFLAGSAALLASAGGARAQGFPTHPITLVVPFSPGGNIDITGRLVAGEMSKQLGQPIVISNRAGGGGIAGMEFVAHAAGDGYTLAINAIGSLLVSPRLLPRPPYSPADFAPVGMVAVTPMILEVNASSKYQTFGYLIDAARAAPGKIVIGHSGYGTTNHVAALQMQSALGVTFNLVPYRGSAPALTDLMGGQIDAVMDQVTSSLSLLRAKSLRALATTTRTRAKDLPDVPSMAELGVKDFDASTPSGLFAPAKTPAALVAQINKALDAALADGDVKGRLLALGNDPQPGSPEQFATFIGSEQRRVDALFGAGLLKPE